MRKHALVLLLAAWPLAGCDQIPQPQSEGRQATEASSPSTSAEAPVRGAAADATAADEPEADQAYPGSGTEAVAGAPDATAADDAEPADRAAASAPATGASADMLSAQEISRAEQLALGGGEARAFTVDATDRDELSEAAAEGDAEALRPMAERPNYRVLYTQRLPLEKGDPSRAAEVMVYRYDLGQAQRSKVDLGSGAVEALDVPEGFPVPLVPEEIMEAAAVARADEQVKEALKAAGMDPEGAKANGIITRAVEDGAVCAIKRCVRLFFSTERQPMPSFNVVVNLDDLTVVELAQMPGLEAQP